MALTTSISTASWMSSDLCFSSRSTFISDILALAQDVRTNCLSFSSVLLPPPLPRVRHTWIDRTAGNWVENSKSPLRGAGRRHLAVLLRQCFRRHDVGSRFRHLLVPSADHAAFASHHHLESDLGDLRRTVVFIRPHPCIRHVGPP